jgi:hypothetical protein
MDSWLTAKRVGAMCANFFCRNYLDVLRLSKTKMDIDFLEFIVYNTGTRSVESNGHGHGNSPLAAVGDREAVGSRHSAQT